MSLKIIVSYSRFYVFMNVLLLLMNFAYGVGVVDLDRGNSKPIAIGISHFKTVENDKEQLFARNIHKVISDDLNNSKLFQTISPLAFLHGDSNDAKNPQFALWRQIKADVFVNGSIEFKWGSIYINFIIWDVVLGKQIHQASVKIATEKWRLGAHLVANSIYQQILGVAGHFDSQIAYVSEEGPYLKRRKRIAIIDQDGANVRYLTDGQNLVMAPKFSPDNKHIIYLAYINEKPNLYLLEIQSGKSKLLGHFPGMSFAPKFSPNGKHIIMSIAKDAATNIFEYSLVSQKLMQLTFSQNNINTSPSYSPDGKNIIFNSDQGGRRNLYVMDARGGSVRRISFGGGSYYEPEWSAQNVIAFTKISRTHGFTIGVSKPDLFNEQREVDYHEKLIAKGYLVESPSWSMNGQEVAFTKGIRSRPNQLKGINRIYIADANGRFVRILPTPTDAISPNWSN